LGSRFASAASGRNVLIGLVPSLQLPPLVELAIFGFGMCPGVFRADRAAAFQHDAPNRRETGFLGGA
jgi:hypothetical protein